MTDSPKRPVKGVWFEGKNLHVTMRIRDEETEVFTGAYIKNIIPFCDVDPDIMTVEELNVKFDNSIELELK